MRAVVDVDVDVDRCLGLGFGVLGVRLDMALEK